MATEVGVAYVTVLPSARGFRSNLERAVGRDVTAVGSSAGSSFGRSFASRAQSSIRAGLSRSLSAVRSFSASAAREIGRVGVAAGAAVAGAGLLGLKTAANLQSAQIGFESILKSAKRATAFLGKIREFAVATPFNVEDLIANARALLGVQVRAKAVIPTLTALGDATAALGLNQDQFNGVLRAYTQIASKGRVQAEELLQISENGIPAVQLFAKALHLTVPELQAMTKQGQLTADVALPALLKQLNKDYGGSMQRQFATLTGLFNNFKETTKLALSDGIQPLVPMLQNVLPRATAAVGRGIKAASSALAGFIRGVQGAQFDDGKVSFFEKFGAAAKTAFERIKAGVRAALPILGGLWSFFVNDLIPAIRGFFEVVGPQIKATFSDIAGTIRDNQGTFRALGTILTGVIIPAVAQVVRLLSKGMGPQFKAMVTVIKFVVIPAFALLAKTWLLTVDTIVSAAAHAFGWVPGIGGKLKAANASFDKFAAGVNASLDSIIRDVFVTVHIQTSSSSDLAGGFNGESLTPQQAAAQNQRNQIAARSAKTAAEKAKEAAKQDGFDWDKILADMFRGGGTSAGTGGAAGGTSKAAKAAKDTVNKAVEAAKTALKDAKKELADYAKSVRDSIRSFGDLTTISSQTGAAATPNSLKFFLQRQLETIRRFRANLEKLKKRGISDSLLRKIADAGVETGGPVAAALVAADKGQFSEIQTLDRQINRNAASIGSSVAGQLFGSNVAQHQARVEQLLGRIAAKKHLEVSGTLKIDDGSTPRSVRQHKLAASL